MTVESAAKLTALWPSAGMSVRESPHVPGHFLTPDDSRTFAFTEGKYQVEISLRLVGEGRNTQVFSQTLEISREAATALAQPGTGLYFDWGPDSARYMPHIERHLPPPSPAVATKTLGRVEG